MVLKPKIGLKVILVVALSLLLRTTVSRIISSVPHGVKMVGQHCPTLCRQYSVACKQACHRTYRPTIKNYLVTDCSRKSLKSTVVENWSPGKIPHLRMVCLVLRAFQQL